MVFNIDNICFLSIKSGTSIILTGSRDTEDWSNYAENSALHHINKLKLKIQISYFKL